MGRDGGALDGAVAPTVPEDLVSMLDLLAETIVEALGFGVAAINIACTDGSLKVVSVAGDDDARRTLLGTSEGADVWDRLLAVGQRWGRLHFLDHRDDDAERVGLQWTPEIEMVDAPDAWHPEDALFAPLTASDGSRLGVLSVDLPHDGLRPGPATRKALEAFAISTALAIEHATLRTRAEASERRYQRLASHDVLTGVGNRSLLLDRLRQTTSRRRQDRSLMALVFVDLDGFKAVNDRYTHVMGDLVLTTVAQRLRSEVRPHDTVVRWGGDEFLVLLEQLDDEVAALEVVRRLESSVAAPIAHRGQDVAVTASVGVVFHRPDDEVDGEELVRRADAAMYRVKRSGRSDVGVFDATTDRAVLLRSSL
jgi:diguanylate cyclase (GGDEF)-like protein